MTACQSATTLPTGCRLKGAVVGEGARSVPPTPLNLLPPSASSSAWLACTTWPSWDCNLAARAPPGALRAPILHHADLETAGVAVGRRWFAVKQERRRSSAS